MRMLRMSQHAVGQVRCRSTRPPRAAASSYNAKAVSTAVSTTEGGDPVSVDGGRLRIRDLEVPDPEVASYFGDLPESERPEKLARALRIGVLAITSTGAAQNVNFVEKAFDAMKTEFDRKMESVFDEKGPVSDVIARNFGADGAVVKEHLNPDREGSPLHSLREYLNRTLAEIRDAINAREAAREAAAKGTQKGRRFEEQCKEGLEEAARPYSDAIDPTGDVSGRAGRSKKGDFVATLDGSGKRIVFEMKDVERIGPTGVRAELKEAMDNRDAAYGVLVARSRASLTGGIGWFNEYDGNKLACALEDAEGNPAMDGGMIEVAYRWARARAAEAPEAREGEVDAALIKEKVKEIGDHISEARSIKRECTNIDNSSKKIRGWAESAEKGLRAKIDAVVESIGAG